MTLCSVEIPRGDGTYWMGHKGIELKDPEAYAAKSGCRVTPVPVCPACGELHAGPGMCLI